MVEGCGTVWGLSDHLRKCFVAEKGYNSLVTCLFHFTGDQGSVNLKDVASTPEADPSPDAQRQGEFRADSVQT